MKKQNEEVINNVDLNLDLSVVESAPIPILKSEEEPTPKARAIKRSEETKEFINCLRNERVTVRFLRKDTGFIQNPKHLLAGGMAETATRIFTVPILANGAYKNVLTNDEKDFLEESMGLPKNALSVYLKENNYWATQQVRLTKSDTYLDLSAPADYIKYKILLANTDSIAPNLETVSNYPKATYQFVLISEKDEIQTSRDAMTISMEASEAFSKLGNDVAMFRLIIEMLEGRPTSSNVKLDFIKPQVFRIMQANPKHFLSIVQDKMLSTKLLIKEATEVGLIRKRGDFYYLAQDNKALSNGNEDPVLSNACKFLNNPINQELRLMLEAKIKLNKA